MKHTKFLSFFSAVLLILLLLAGCSSSGTGGDADTNADTNAGAGYEEGTSETDNIVDTSPAEKVLLVVSFGTSFNQSRDLTIGGIETALKAAYPDYQVRRAFTSQIIIDKLAERDNLNIDNIEQAMDRLVLDNVREVVIQPTTVMSGFEYDDVIAAVAPYADSFESLKVGKPLLIDDVDYEEVAGLLVEETAESRADGTAIVFMGHGTHHDANATYTKLQGILNDSGHADCLLGTVEAAPTLEDVQAALKEMGATKVVLRPLMIVAGDHANNDMAGDGEDSWKTILTNDGYDVETVIEGLGQLKSVQDIFIRHVKEAMDSEESIASADTATSNAGITAGRIKNGTYSINVDSDTSMFKIVDCQLTVAEGGMSAVMTLSGQGYRKVYMGTGEQALAEGGDSGVYFTDNGGRHTFTVPVSALNKEIDCAGFSDEREVWYDHVVVFNAANITDDAFLPYQTAVALEGGSGKASVASPANISRKDGADYAEIVWSSPNYTYMVIDGVKYLPVSTEGNSTFEIPVPQADVDIIACTEAMGSPREIEYTLKFDYSAAVE